MMGKQAPPFPAGWGGLTGEKVRLRPLRGSGPRAGHLGRGSLRAVAPGEGVGRTGFGLWAPEEGSVPRAVALSALQPAACGLKGKTETPTNFTSKKTAVARLDPDRARLGSEPPRS